MCEVKAICAVPVNEVLSSSREYLLSDRRRMSIIMETIAGRRLFQSAAITAGKHHEALLRRVPADANNMLAVLRSAGLAGCRGWRSAAAEAVAASPVPKPMPLRNAASEAGGGFCGCNKDHIGCKIPCNPPVSPPLKPHCYRRAKPLFRGRHCLEVAYLCPMWDDEDRILDFMKKTFFRHEPTMVATGLSGRVPESMLGMYRDALREGLSVMAVDADDPSDILGVAINGAVRRGVDSKHLRCINAECEATRKIYDLWAYLLDRPEVWPEDLECVMEMKAVATNPKVARSGLAANLTQLSRELAREQFNYKGFRVDCTSLYSAKMAERIRLPKVLSFRYKDYLNSNGEAVFKIPAPHTEVKVYVEHFYEPQVPYEEQN